MVFLFSSIPINCKMRGEIDMNKKEQICLVNPGPIYPPRYGGQLRGCLKSTKLL